MNRIAVVAQLIAVSVAASVRRPRARSPPPPRRPRPQSGASGATAPATPARPADPYGRRRRRLAHRGRRPAIRSTVCAGGQPREQRRCVTDHPAPVGLADVTAVQGLLAVQHLDGWLLFDRDGENPDRDPAGRADGHPTRPWFYMIPARGAPVALVHTTELRSFDHLAGTKLTYQGYRDLDKQLRAMLKASRRWPSSTR